MPLIPAPPNCMCVLKPVIRGMLDNETPHERIEDGGMEYLRSVNSHQRRLLLGVYGAKAVMEGKVSWTELTWGYGGRKVDSRLSKNLFEDGIMTLEIRGYGKAVFPEAKLTQYALNPEKNKDKAEAFRSALGYGLQDANELARNVAKHINDFSPVEKPDNGYGKRFQILMSLTGKNGKSANVMTAWIKDKNTGVVRLISIYVKE